MAEEDAGPPAGIAGGGRDLALLSPNALRDGFLEQQREIRDAEDRVMRLQCVYNEEKVRLDKVCQEHGALKAETERHNQKLIEVTEETLRLQAEHQRLCKEIEDLNCARVRCNGQVVLLKQECGKARHELVQESERMDMAVERLAEARAEIQAYNEDLDTCELVRELRERAEDFLAEGISGGGFGAAGAGESCGGEDPVARLILEAGKSSTTAGLEGDQEARLADPGGPTGAA